MRTTFKYGLFLACFLASSYSVATYGQVLHDPHVIHDTLSVPGGGGGGGNATYATNAGNANTANYATQSGTSSSSNTAQYVIAGGNVITGPINANSVTLSNGSTIAPGTVNGVAGGLVLNAGNPISGYQLLLSRGALSIANINATGYGVGWADSSHLTFYSGGAVAMSLDSAQNTSHAGNLNLKNASILTDTANGTVQITNSGGTSGAFLIGPATTSGILLSQSGGSTLVLSTGGSTPGTPNASVYGYSTIMSYLRSSGAGTAANPVVTQNGVSNTGMYFPTANGVGFSTNGTLALGIDSSQNATFAASLTSANNILTNTSGSALLSSGGSVNIKNPTANTTQFGFLQGSSGNAFTGLRYVGAGVSRIVGDETGTSTTPGALYMIPPTFSISAAQTLTAAQCGSWVNTTGSTAFTVTLPATPTVGCPFEFTNLATATLTVSSGSTALVTGSTLLTGTSRTLGTAGTSINTMQVKWNGTAWNITKLVGTVN